MSSSREETSCGTQTTVVVSARKDTVDLFSPYCHSSPRQHGRRHGNEQVRLVTDSVPIPGQLECPALLH